MSAQNQGRQSPPPEEQSGAQQQDAPSSGTGVNPETKNKEESESQLEGLSSNPKGPLDDHVAEVAKKTVNQ
ncbi:uncharacterized protein LY89DRAFT_682430 [Mollisia scopiformis]|uniref:Uncharacterized protein n=1 Tax=Mollisia scopiformis TaxID=149040 RepID=A0A194XKW2_MOLSC|nr:uncharacterized protein LY89DRAFT_682430 [Mollisia scopiformis]KUJ20734.1 hypothetical protein LY89DRAFT_682430 [Mollisia scopiformis]